MSRLAIVDFLGDLFEYVTGYRRFLTLRVERQHPDLSGTRFPIVDDADSTAFPFSR